MKKIITLVLALAMAVSLLAGCGKKNNAETGESDSNKLSVVTTIFPEYDWVREILGDKAESTDLTMLLDNGVDLHSYQPTADDIVKISDCDLFVYVGGESDGWVKNVLKNAVNKKMKVINLLEMLGDSVKTEETVEGMQKEGHDHGHSHDEQLTENDIEDRTLSDFAGAWKSLHPFLLNGDLDKFCEHRAEEDEDSSTTKDTYLEKYKAAWQCDAEKISTEGNNITFTYADGKTVSAEYMRCRSHTFFRCKTMHFPPMPVISRSGMTRARSAASAISSKRPVPMRPNMCSSTTTVTSRARRSISISTLATTASMP